MRAAQLFALVIGLMLAVGLTISRLRNDPKQQPDMRVRTPNGAVVEMRVVQNGSGLPDPRLGPYLRSALVFEESYRAERGQYTKDLSSLDRDRPANTKLYIVKLADDGLRMTAINSKTEVQCDVFSGDSAAWAFGYAYDNHTPRCGKMR